MRARGSTAMPVALAELGDAALDLARVDEELLPLAAVVAEDHVLGHGERRDEPEVLVHHADPGVERVARRVELDRLAVEQDLALVRPVEPGEDVRERALAGAVLAEQRVHLALGASKSTPSFATTPGNRFVIPRSSTAASAVEAAWGAAELRRLGPIARH